MNAESPRPEGPPRVLIVEDEAITALDLSTELRGLGYDVCGVVDTEAEAIEAAVRERPAVVLMDVRLADGGDGIEAARRIGARQDAAIVFLTAQSDEATLARALEVSPFGYLIKPFRARELKVALDVAIAKHARVAEAARHLESLAATDALTGLANRREIVARLEAAWHRCRQRREPLAVMMVDVDHFKQLNDARGHIAGDECLRQVAGVMRRVCGGDGTALGRWGGEEFLAVLPGLELQAAAGLADRLVRSVRAAGLPHPAAVPGGIVTVSVGVAALAASDATPEGLVERADRGLYHAKYAGRDCVATNPLPGGTSGMIEATHSRSEEGPSPQAEDGRGALAELVRMARDGAPVHDRETARHLERMAQYARLIARHLAVGHGLTDEFVEQVFLFAPLHDIGKVGIPDAILHKPESLTADERAVMATHVSLGIELIEELISRFRLERLSGIQVLRNIIACHHEYLDGSGYPQGLRGDAVPLEARIVTVADIFDALSSRRDYKPAWSIGDAFATLDRMTKAGKLDVACVGALTENEDAIRGILPFDAT